METRDIRESLHYHTYIEYSLSMKYAADEILGLFNSQKDKMFPDVERVKGLGFYRSALLLYAISVELILKAVGLYSEKENIKSGKIISFNDFMNCWKNKRKNGHDYYSLINHYQIKITAKEKELVENLQPYSNWDGRFPFPQNEEEIKKIEKGLKNHGNLSLTLNNEIEAFIKNRMEEMV